MAIKTHDPWFVTFALLAHDHQLYGDKPYEFHIRGVAGVATHFGFTDEPTQMLCFNHDVGEDCINPRTGKKYTKEDFIAAGFPPIVAAAIMAITDKEGKDRAETKALTLPVIAAFVVNPAETGFSVRRPVVLGKLCDRGFNLAQGKPTRNAKYRRYQKEHPDFVAALYDPNETELQPLWDWVNSLVAD